MRTTVMLAVGVCTLFAGAPAVRADEGPAVMVAKGWLGALREKDPSKLKLATGFPFTEAGIGAGGKCGKRAKAGDAASFEVAAECMIADAQFVESVPPTFDAKIVQLKQITNPTFKKNMKSLSPLAKDHTFVTATIAGNETKYEVLLAVKKGAVTLVLAESAPAE